MEKSEILVEASDFAKDLSELSESDKQAIKNIIIGIKLKAEIDSHKQAG